MLKEVFVLESKIGKERLMKPIIETEVRCEVVNPLLEISEREINFQYLWEENQEPIVQRKDIQLKNISALTLNFILKVEVPFNLSEVDFSLQPGETAEVTVEFDPMYQDTKASTIVDKFMMVTYRGHPQKDQIKVHGEIVFPNLKFESTDINFGCVLNDTSKHINIKITNTSSVQVTYEWIFVETMEATGKKGIKNKSARNVLQPAQVFDILPARNILLPGESEDVEFTMQSGTDTKIVSTAICVVTGGPEYRVTLTGESSTVGFALDKSGLDFKNVVFTSKKDEELYIYNTGKVIFDYVISGSGNALGLFDISPMTGKVNPGEKQRVIFTIRPAFPNVIKEIFTIRIAHFEPVRVTCYCVGIFPSVVATLPRQKKVGPFGEFSDASSRLGISAPGSPEMVMGRVSTAQRERDDHKSSILALWSEFQALATSNIMTTDPSLAPLEGFYPPLAGGTTALPPMHSLTLTGDEGTNGMGGNSRAGTAKYVHMHMNPFLYIFRAFICNVCIMIILENGYE
jgi:hydrocephalus-inducing protein